MLTAKEHALLEYFAPQQGRLLGREEIAAHVWDENFDPMSNVIDVYARRLRKKVDEGSLDDRRFLQVYDLFTGVGATIA